MEKKKEQIQEVSLTDAYSLFVYAIRTQRTRDYDLRKLRSFFDFIELLPNARKVAGNVIIVIKNVLY